MKVIRGTYARQGKSPNDFGFSQSRALSALGFPYVTLAHLVVSDENPRSAWRDIGTVRKIGPTGEAEWLPPRPFDWLPIDITERAFGRLVKLGFGSPDVGLILACLGSRDPHLTGEDGKRSLWYPTCRRASLKVMADRRLLESVARLFEREPSRFLDTPRYDPTSASSPGI